MPCEMCGADASLRRATIEGTVMMVCVDCSKFGVEVAGHETEVTGKSKVVESLQRRASRMGERDIYAQMGEELVDDYGERIRKARQAKALTVEDLAKKIGEKAGFLSKIESGSQRPSDDLVKRLERELAIKLREKQEPEIGSSARKTGSAGPLTLGDMIRRKLEDK